jgi:hypothetical protein
MGSLLSPLLANIYMSKLENDFLDHEVSENNIIFVCRYVDDYIFFSKTSEVRRIFNSMNSIDPHVKFTMEGMSDNQLPFLDTKLVLTDSGIDLHFYSKPTSTDLLQNFRKSVSPKSQKTGLLCGEIIRVSNTTTTEKSLDEGLNILKSKFLRNEYPLKLIESKIKMFRDKKVKNITLTEEAESFTTERKRYFSIDYTSERCSKIGYKIKKIIEDCTPTFKLIPSFKTIRLEGILFLRLKEPIPLLEKSGVVYKFTCPCGISYIGQTKRQLSVRCKEHAPNPKPTVRTRANSKIKDRIKGAIEAHIDQCEVFKDKHILTNLGKPNTAKIKREDFITEMFTILKSNLQNYFDRVISEAFFIKLQNPVLNIQVTHHNVKFL